FAKTLGVPWLVRKLASKSYPTLEITQNGDEFSSKLVSLMHTFDVKFTVGTEFEERQPNGVVMKIMPRWEGDKLVMDYRPKNPGEAKDQTMIREMVDDELVLTAIVDNIVSKRFFKRLE
ncbi:hypothetical protein HELRODRAFT_87779, partial [Helobdella robusta]|uniref:Lipocalin/cytosolic fatty-acid binding domain-containing protein n=1 Tax=Helobdella robusta TaxID=6412 RepID=T1G6V3_HELRO